VRKILRHYLTQSPQSPQRKTRYVCDQNSETDEFWSQCSPFGAVVEILYPQGVFSQRSLRSRANEVSGREIKKPLNIFSLAEPQSPQSIQILCGRQAGLSKKAIRNKTPSLSLTTPHRTYLPSNQFNFTPNVTVLAPV